MRGGLICSHTSRVTRRDSQGRGSISAFPALFLFWQVNNMPGSPLNTLLAFSAGILALAALIVPVPVHGQIAVRNQGFVPFSDEPINYRSEHRRSGGAAAAAPERGETTLDVGAAQRLPEIGARTLLHVSETSQMLVFSKTSFQYKKISPTTPRALYFNDDVYVGKVHDGKALEVISFDARQGRHLLPARRAAGREARRSSARSSTARFATWRRRRATCPVCWCARFIRPPPVRRRDGRRPTSPATRARWRSVSAAGT